jgi:hypothetical protein
LTLTPVASPVPLAASLLMLGQGLAVAVYATAQFLLVTYSSHRWTLVWRRWRRERSARRATGPAAGGVAREAVTSRFVAGRAPSRGAAAPPVATVQLPVYNERRVVERLIDAVAAFDYRRDRLEIQVLDDSTDETRALAAAAVARHRARGVDIVHVVRDERHGFKAGALAAGLARARGDVIAVFDADFAPPPDFLIRAIAHFADPDVGLVQARWTHLNRDESLLTTAQAVQLDAHFLIEHEERMRAGCFFNFNGTAGVWRREAIESAGGWQHDTLTEDLDLSYRAQLAGWRFVFDGTLEAPAELPAEVEALKAQQRRWTKGSIQTARKLLPAVWRSARPFGVKLEATLHLTGNASYPLLLVLGLLLLPVLLGQNRLPFAVVVALQIAVVLLGIVPVTWFLAAGQRGAGGSLARRARDVGAAVVLGLGLAVNNSRAVVEGLAGGLGEWERTAKRGTHAGAAAPAPYAAATRRSGRSEIALALYFCGLGGFALAAGEARAVPFVALLALGLAWVGWASFRASEKRAG